MIFCFMLPFRPSGRCVPVARRPCPDERVGFLGIGLWGVSWKHWKLAMGYGFYMDRSPQRALDLVVLRFPRSGEGQTLQGCLDEFRDRGGEVEEGKLVDGDDHRLFCLSEIEWRNMTQQAGPIATRGCRAWSHTSPERCKGARIFFAEAHHSPIFSTS